MQQAPELKDMLIRIYDAVSRGDGELIEQITSRQDGMVFIGTDPKEWLEDAGSVRRMLEAQAGAGVTVVPGDVRAYRIRRARSGGSPTAARSGCRTATKCPSASPRCSTRRTATGSWSRSTPPSRSAMRRPSATTSAGSGRRRCRQRDATGARTLPRWYPCGCSPV